MSRTSNRLHLEFGCGRLKLAGTLDQAPGTTGLLIVSGGNEPRSGAFSGQSLLAAKLSKKGFPVFRFDRRGIGDSEGENRGFRSSSKDIQAASDAFRALAPQIDRVFAFGNCDAASALMLCSGVGIEGLILSNPWTIDDATEADDEAEAVHAPAAIRSRYAQKLKNPREVLRLLRGGVDLGKLVRGLTASMRSAPSVGALVDDMRVGLSGFEGRVQFLLASEDRTAQLFDAAWHEIGENCSRCSGAGHAYVEPEHQEWLENEILKVLRA